MWEVVLEGIGWGMASWRRSMAVLVVGAAMAVGSLAAIPATSAAWTPTPGGWVSGPLEHVDTIPLEAGGASDLAVHDGVAYVTGYRSFSIYDVSDPLAPSLLSVVPLSAGAYAERPRTNGEILLVSGDGINDSMRARLDVYDVTDPEQPVRIGQYLSQQPDHIWTCVLDCTYAYSAGGTILDLTDPTSPQEVADFRQIAPTRYIHVVEEVAPGIVVLGASTTYVLDAREDPLRPEVLVSVEPPATTPSPNLNPQALPARVAWPRGVASPEAAVTVRDRWVPMPMETPFTGPCTEESGGVLTFDTAGWQGSGTWSHVGTFRLATNGTYSDGAPPYNAVGCSSYGLDVRPEWGVDQRRHMAVTFFEHGIRLLDVDTRGEISELAGFVPHGGNATSVAWLDEDVLLVTDLQRGLDILRVTN